MGDSREHLQAADAAWPAECGRGLWLVDELADDWGTAAYPGHRCVWIDLPWQANGGEVVDEDIATMRRAFPDTTIWWGHQTRAWWAALPGSFGTSGLVSAAARGELCQLLTLCPASGESMTGRENQATGGP